MRILPKELAWHWMFSLFSLLSRLILDERNSPLDFAEHLAGCGWKDEWRVSKPRWHNVASRFPVQQHWEWIALSTCLCKQRLMMTEEIKTSKPSPPPAKKNPSAFSITHSWYFPPCTSFHNLDFSDESGVGTKMSENQCCILGLISSSPGQSAQLPLCRAASSAWCLRCVLRIPSLSCLTKLWLLKKTTSFRPHLWMTGQCWSDCMAKWVILVTLSQQIYWHLIEKSSSL